MYGEFALLPHIVLLIFKTSHSTQIRFEIEAALNAKVAFYEHK